MCVWRIRAEPQLEQEGRRKRIDLTVEHTTRVERIHGYLVALVGELYQKKSKQNRFQRLGTLRKLRSSGDPGKDRRTLLNHTETWVLSGFYF